MKTKLLLVTSVFALSLSACSDRKNLSPLPSISEESKAAVAKPTECRTAESDIAVLREERASVAKQLISGVRSVMPIAAAAGILLGDYKDRVKVATGKYNSDIDAKIAEIQRKCGVQ